MKEEYSMIEHTACLGRITVLYEITKVIQDKLLKEQKLLSKFKKQEKHNGKSETSTD